MLPGEGGGDRGALLQDGHIAKLSPPDESDPVSLLKFGVFLNDMGPYVMCVH